MQILRLSDLALLASEDRYSLQTTVDVAVQLLKVPMAMITVVEAHRDRQVFLAHEGLNVPYGETSETSLDASLCKDVIRFGEPLVINDLSRDRKYRDHPALTRLKVKAYIGMPIFGPFDRPFAAICVGDTEPREWENRDINIMNYLARQTTRYMQNKAQRVLDRSGVNPAHVLID